MQFTTKLLAALAVGVISGFAGSAEARLVPWIEGQASVIDGDTIEIHGERIRFNGIDAPESDQLCSDGGFDTRRCGSEAAFHLADLIGEKTVRCDVLDEDKYGRSIANCFIETAEHGSVNLNAQMVLAGMAVAYRRYSMEYVPHEEEAKADNRGVWQGRFEMPWDYRRQK